MRKGQESKSAGLLPTFHSIFFSCWLCRSTGGAVLSIGGTCSVFFFSGWGYMTKRVWRCFWRPVTILAVQIHVSKLEGDFVSGSAVRSNAAVARKRAAGLRCENAPPLIGRVVFLQVSQSMTCLEQLISAIIPQLH